jgi:hypothetical protein
MKEESSINPSAVPDETKAEVVSWLKKMQQQLLFEERKVIWGNSHEQAISKKTLFETVPFLRSSPAPRQGRTHAQLRRKGPCPRPLL